MKKLVITIGTLLTGGAEVFVVNLIKNLDKTKFAISLIVLDKKNNSFLEEDLDKINIRIYYLNKPVGFSLKTILKTYRLLAKIKPDIIHGNIGGIIYSLLYVFLHRVLTIHTIHTLASKEFGSFKRIILRYLYLKRKIIPVIINQANLAEFLGVYQIPEELIKIINNGIDLKRFNHTKNFTNKHITLGHVGRFEEVKNHKTIFLVFGELLVRGYDISLRLIGKGSLLNHYKQSVNSEKVFFIAESKNIEEELAKIDIFIFPSIYEGMPLSLLEAMASGCVIVASNIGGINQLIEEHINGYKFLYNDINSFVLCLENLIKNPIKMKEISNNNINKAKEFSIDVMIRKYTDLYLSGGK